MSSTIHRNFRHIADAEKARAALLLSGFDGTAVQLNTHAVRPMTTTAAAVQHIFDSLTPDAVDHTDQREHPDAMLSVDVYDDAQRERADNIMARYGAVEA